MCLSRNVNFPLSCFGSGRNALSKIRLMPFRLRSGSFRPKKRGAVRLWGPSLFRILLPYE